MKKYTKWGIGIALFPFALFVVICILLYVPPVQRFLVSTATRYASEASGMDIHIGRLSLSFPLDLVVHEAQVVDGRDTILNVDRLTVEVQLLPLVRRQVEIDGVRLTGAAVNTAGLVEGMTLKGEMGELFLRSHGVDLSPETAVLNNLLLKDTHLSLCLADTTESVDTAASAPLYWKVDLQDIDLENVSFAMQMPLDSMDFRVKLGKAALRDGLIDLRKSAYTVQHFSIRQGEADYNSGGAPMAEAGLDPSHIRVRDINIGIDSIYYEGNHIRALIRELGMKERSGLEITSTEGRLIADERVISVPSFEVRTPDSYLTFEASADWSLAASDPDGTLRARLMAEIGKTDLFRFMPAMPEAFAGSYPSAPLRIQVGLDGSLKELRLTQANIAIPESFRVETDGVLTNLLDSAARAGTFNLSAAFQNMDFVEALAGGGIAVPQGMTIDGKAGMRGNLLEADVALRNDSGRVELVAGYDLSCDAYHAEVDIDSLDMHAFLPGDSLFHVSASLRARGEGLDFFSPQTVMEAEGGLSCLEYGSRTFSGVSLDASLKHSKAVARLEVKDALMDVSSRLEAALHPRRIKADMNMEVRSLDLRGLELVATPLKTAEKVDLHLSTDMRESHSARLSVRDIHITTAQNTFHTKDLHLGFSTARDSIRSYANAGDLTFLFRARGGVEQLADRAARLGAMLAEQWEAGYVDQEVLKEHLPEATFYIFAKNDNPLANMLGIKNISFSRLFTRIETSPASGLKGDAYLYSLRTDSLELDTIYFNLMPETGRMVFKSGVIAGNKPFQEAFDISLNGDIGADRANVMIDYLNGKKECGVHLGFIAGLQKEGISIHISPNDPTLVYRKFRVNPRNYIYLKNEGRIEADLGIFDENHTGIHLYSTPDSTVQQDLTLAINRLDIAEFRRVVPYMPDIAGVINAEAHYVQAGKLMQVSADVNVDRLAYNSQPLGNWGMSGVYLPLETGEQSFDGFITLENTEIASVNGSYLAASGEGEGRLEAEMGLHHFPLHIANAFIPDRMAVLSGDMDGTLAVSGSTSRPLINGEINLDSVNVNVPQASLNLRFDNRPVRIADSRLTFDKFSIYTAGKTPFTIDGDVDMSDLADMKLDLLMNAHNFEVLNAKKTKESMVYGKLYIDFNAMLRGSLTAMTLRGNANILGTSDFTYILQDSPLTVEDRLGETVTFVNFNDTAAAARRVIPAMTLGGMDMLMTLHIDEAVQCQVDMDENGSNYMMFEGGGDLSFQYTPEGNMLLNGRYSLMSGELKYQMPVIPLKTFHIRSGSYIEWTGNIMNPNLNIQASERVRASVAQEDQSTRTVNFDVGVSITNRLENLGFVFTLEAPDDGTMQNELAGMSAEERNKLAVTMLVTGMYLAEGNTAGGGGMSANSMLNSFLEGQINKVAGSALKTIDVNFGMEQTEQGGNTQTDYNFQFAKRFWNNRFSVIIGGKVSTGNNAAQQDDSFIDNISLEYRLDNSGTRYIKIFHDKNYENILDGEVTETGAGIVLRKKISKLSELFIFRSRKKKPEAAEEESKKENKEETDEQ